MSGNHVSASIEAERSVIGCLLIAGDRIPTAREVLASEDFTDVRLRAIWNALCQLDESRISVDFLTVGNALKASGYLDLIGGHDALVELTNQIASPSRVPHHCQLVAEASTLRRVINVCRDAINEAQDIQPGISQVEPFVEMLERSILDVSARRHKASALVTVAESMPEIVHALTDDSAPHGLETGLCDIDERLRGIRAGELVVLAARPGVGKSAVAGQIALNVARDGGVVLFISLEMSRESLIQRVLCNVGSIDSAWMRDRRFSTPEGRELLQRAVSQLGDAAHRIVIDDVGHSTLMRVRALARRCAARGGLDLIVVDYLQLLSEPRAEKRWEEVGQVSRGLKALAKEQAVPVVALAQLGREAANNDRPLLHHLRESGSIEQDADAVVLLWGGEGEEQVVELNCHVAKNRHGQRGLCSLRFDRRYFRLGNAGPTSVAIYDGGADGGSGR